LILSVAVGCADLDLAGLCFPCATDDQCGPSHVCDPVAAVCIRPGEPRCAPSLKRGDAGSTDASSSDAQENLRDAAGTCGDGVVDVNEACDDGNQDDRDQCGNDCRPTCERYDAVATGWRHTAAIRRDGTLWMFGRNTDHQLGDGTVASRFVPVQIGEGLRWAHVDGGMAHTIALSSDGVLWVWGRNHEGQLGLDDREVWLLTPTRFRMQRDWRLIAAGENVSFAQDVDGTLWAWGENDSGELGVGDTMPRIGPVQVDAGPFVAIEAHRNAVIALDAEGDVYFWGDTLREIVTTPTKVDGLPNIVAVSTGVEHRMALDDSQRIWVWGSDAHRQLGDGDRNRDGSTSDPRQFEPVLLDGASDWVAIEAVYRASLAIKRDGSL